MKNASNDFNPRAQSSAVRSQLRDDMRVLSSDGLPVGTIDHVEDERIQLKRIDSPDGEHHHLPIEDVERIEDDAVILSLSHAQAREYLENESEGIGLSSDDDLDEDPFSDNPAQHLRSSDASKVDQRGGTSIGQNPDEPDRLVS